MSSDEVLAFYMLLLANLCLDFKFVFHSGVASNLKLKRMFTS